MHLLPAGPLLPLALSSASGPAPGLFRAATRRAGAVRALFTALGLLGGGVVLVAAAAQWLATAVQVHGGHMPRALGAIWAVVARGSLYITTSTSALTIWAPPHDLFHLPTLGFEAGLENTGGIRACLFELVELGAWHSVSRSLSQPDSWAQCRRPVKWFRQLTVGMLVEAQEATREAMECVMREVDREEFLGRDRERWMEVGGWGKKVEGNGGN